MKEDLLYFKESISEELVTYSKKLIDFVKVGKLLHLTAIVSFPIVYWLYLKSVEAWAANDFAGIVFYSYFTLHMFTIPIFAELDARSRYQNFKMVCDLFYQYGFNSRFVKSMQYSKCQREAVMVAATKTGYAQQAKEFFLSCGKRWYHFYPTFIFTNPMFLVTKQFLFSTFFVKNYQPKYFHY